MKEAKNKMVHVSFDIVDKFEPRVPKQRCRYEDSVTPRICVAPDLRSALVAIPQAGETVSAMMRIGLPLVIHAYYMKSNNVRGYLDIDVPDSVMTREMWILDKPERVQRIDYEIESPLIVTRKDIHGTVGKFIQSAKFKRVKYQENWRNLSEMMGKSGQEIDEFMDKKPNI